jgi:hypothetical protein
MTATTSPAPLPDNLPPASGQSGSLGVVSGSAIPTRAGYYWFTGVYGFHGEWRLVEVFRPCWCDRERQDLRWRYLDRSGGEESDSDVATCAGQWSDQVLPPAKQNNQDDTRSSNNP